MPKYHLNEEEQLLFRSEKARLIFEVNQLLEEEPGHKELMNILVQARKIKGTCPRECFVMHTLHFKTFQIAQKRRRNVYEK